MYVTAALVRARQVEGVIAWLEIYIKSTLCNFMRIISAAGTVFFSLPCLSDITTVDIHKARPPLHWQTRLSSFGTHYEYLWRQWLIHRIIKNSTSDKTTKQSEPLIKPKQPLVWGNNLASAPTTAKHGTWTWKRRLRTSQANLRTLACLSRVIKGAHPLVSSSASSQTGGRTLLIKWDPLQRVQAIKNSEGWCHVWATWRFCKGIVGRQGRRGTRTVLLMFFLFFHHCDKLHFNPFHCVLI